MVPFLDQIDWYSPEDAKTPWDAEENRRINLLLFRVYLCPANLDQRAETREGLTHYVGIAGVGRDAPYLPLSNQRVGFFGYDRIPNESAQYSVGIALRNIEDGPSLTMVAAETNRANGPWVAGGEATVRGLDPGSPPYLGVDGQFASLHLHGSNALFADASVRFLSDSLERRIFEGIATIAGGEDLGEGGFE
jgi:hypothetical protein